MSQGTADLWERVLKRKRGLKKALSDASVVDSSDDLLAGFDTGIADDGSEPETDDPFAGLNTEFDDNDPSAGLNTESDDDDPFAGLNTEFDDDDPSASFDTESERYEAENAVDILFEESADLWLSRSRLALEHVLLSMGLTRDVFPTNRPLLLFGSHRSRPIAPEYHRVEVTREGWPRRLHVTESLTSTDAAKVLASSHSILSHFEGETIAVEVPNPLLARARWIVLWPELKVLPEAAELHQWRRVRRVVWCVNKEQIGPRDVIDWLSHFWQDTPVRIGLFRAASLVRGEKDEGVRSKVLPKVSRALEKFNAIKNQPWIVVEP